MGYRNIPEIENIIIAMLTLQKVNTFCKVGVTKNRGVSLTNYKTRKGGSMDSRLRGNDTCRDNLRRNDNIQHITKLLHSKIVIARLNKLSLQFYLIINAFLTNLTSSSLVFFVYILAIVSPSFTLFPTILRRYIPA